MLAYNESGGITKVPDGYTPPFYKADRIAEYCQAHAAFAERLARAQCRLPKATPKPGNHQSPLWPPRSPGLRLILGPVGMIIFDAVDCAVACGTINSVVVEGVRLSAG